MKKKTSSLKMPRGIKLDENIDIPKSVLKALKDEGRLRINLSEHLIQQGYNTSISESWEQVLKALFPFLTGRFNDARVFCEEKNIQIPREENDYIEIIYCCNQLIQTLEFMAQSGELFVETVPSPLKQVTQLGYRLRNQLKRGLENNDPSRGYKSLSQESTTKAHERFKDMMGIPYQAYLELAQKIG
jgi:hypothetical protein